jgi:GntR family transcriptional regulator
MTPMSTGPTDARSLQVRIADDIRAKIQTGAYAPGERLPTYAELAEQYMCTIAPARRAIDLLQQQGLIITVQGKGSFVRERPRARRVGRDRYRRSVWLTGGRKLLNAEATDQGLRVDPQMMRFIGEVPAPEAVAQKLGVEPGTLVHVRRRTTVIEGRPNQLADSYYPPDVAAAAPMLAEDDTGPGGGFARLEDAGYHLAEIEEEMSVRMPTSPESVSLHLPAGTPVVDLVRTTYDSTGRPVEVMLAVIAGDMTVFGDRFPIPD